VLAATSKGMHAGSRTLLQHKPPVLNWGRWLTQGDLYSGQKTVMIVEAVVSLTNNKHTKMTLCTAWLKMWIPAKHSSIDSTTVFWSYAEVRLGLPTASKHGQHKDMLRIQKKT